MPRRLFFWIASFAFLFHQGTKRSATIRHTQSSQSEYPRAAEEATAANPTPRPLCIPEFWCQGRHIVFQNLSYIFVYQGLLLYSVGPLGLENLCRPWRFVTSKFQSIRWPSVDSPAAFLKTTSNTERNKSVATMQKSISDRWPKNLCNRCTCANLCWKKVFVMHSALLQHSRSTCGYY